MEVVPEAVFITQDGLKSLGASQVKMRIDEKKGSPFNTEHNNFVLDAQFENIDYGLESRINSLPGVVDNGLFINRAHEVVIAKQDGVYSLILKDGRLEETCILKK